MCCAEVKTDFEGIERSNLTELLLATSRTDLEKKKRVYALPDAYWGYGVTVSEATELLKRYQEAGVQTFICSFHKNDEESAHLFADHIMPCFC